jgi:TonB-linked SusC/RagA family outer membrane protein
LEEVVTIGYGTRRKRDLTGSIATVQSESIEKTNSVSPQFALQGNTAGVRVVTTSGDPNASPQIFIRGIGTWQGSGQPLYVIDGQIITPPQDANVDVISAGNRDTPPNLWSLINPNDIESLTVLKDASSAAIYGSRGANGVILITTKKGKKGAPTVEFNALGGIQNIPTYKMLNTQQFVDLTHEMYANNLNPDVSIEKNLYGRLEPDNDARLISFSPQFDPQSPFYISSTKTYDWQKDLIRSNAFDQSYDVKVSGATDKVDYYMSIGYKDQQSVFDGGGMKRYTAAMNLNDQVNKWLKVGLNYKFAYQETGLDDYSDLPGIASVAPWQPIYDPTSKSGYAEVLDTQPGNWKDKKKYGQGSRENFRAMINLQKNIFILQRHIGQGYVEVLPFKGLNLRGSINLDYATQDRQLLDVYANHIFIPDGQDPATSAPAAPDALGGWSSRVNNIFNYQSDFTATYDRTINKHRITATGVVQDQYNRRNFRDMGTGNLLTIKDFRKIGYGADQANNNSIYFFKEEFWFGMVGRLNYIYDEKYYLDGSYRRDASNGFAKPYRWGNFYSVTGAWRISKEAFMQNLTWIDDLKLRGGWGQAGNDETVVGSFAYLSTVGGSGSYRLGSGNGDAIGNYYPASPVTGFPNPLLTWEVASTTYAGFDAMMLKNKLNVTLELYNRKTSGVQQFVHLPLSVGTDDPAYNIGELTNKGADITAGYNNKIGEVSYSISGNISFLKNRITRLYGDQPIFVDNLGPSTEGLGRIEEGRSIGIIWGYKVDHIFKDQADIDAYYAKHPDQTITDKKYVAPGDIAFKDIGGAPTKTEKYYSTKPDSLINTYDQTEIGNTTPGYTYGLNLNAGMKGFDLSLSFYGEGNVDRYNIVRSQFESMSGAGVNYFATTLNRWTPTNKNSTMPRAVIGDPAGNNRVSDRFVESAAFFRLNSWQLGYTLPDRIMSKIGYAVSSLRIYVTGQNDIYAFRWSGVDPVNDNKPLTRTFYIGLKAKF